MTETKTTSKTSKLVRKITYCAVLIALGLVLPFLTGQIPEIGSALSPLHIPALLAGFLVGPWWGAVCAFIIPLLRSFIFTMPPLFPMACTMAFEMATYALVGGLMQKLLPRKVGYLYAAQAVAMVAGRIVYGIMFALFTLNNDAIHYTIKAFVTGCFVEAIPGIILHLILVPPIVIALRKAKLTAE